MSDPREVLTRPAPEGITRAYGDRHDQVIEWFGPQSGARAVIAFLHGGFWRAEYDRGHVRPLCNSLATEGYAVAAIEYRRTGDGGGFPATFDDVSAAVSVVTATGSPLILAGHSAGGHLALWAAHSLSANGSESDRLAGVLALAPVAALRVCHALDLDGGAATALMGGDPRKLAAEYDSVDPMRLGTVANTIVIHGDADAQVPISMSREFSNRWGATLHELPGIEHYALIDPLSSAWPTVKAGFESLAG